MTEAPEKMWVFPKDDWFIAGASNVRISSAGANDIEYTRTDMARAYLADYHAAYGGSCEQVEELQAEVARLSNILLTISILEGEYRQSGRIARAALEYGEDK